MSRQMLFIDDNKMGVLQEMSYRLLTSQQEQMYRETLRELEKRHEWKTSGTGAQFLGQRNPYKG